MSEDDDNPPYVTILPTTNHRLFLTVTMVFSKTSDDYTVRDMAGPMTKQLAEAAARMVAKNKGFPLRLPR